MQTAEMEKRFRQKGWKQVVGRRMEPCRRQGDAGMQQAVGMEPHISQGCRRGDPQPLDPLESLCQPSAGVYC